MSRGRHRLVGTVVLIVVAALPVTATLCEAFCERGVAFATATTDASAHEGMTGCHESPSPADQGLSSTSTHCRTHDDGRREAEAALTSQRIHAVALSVTNAPTTLGTETLTGQPWRALRGYGPPRGSALSHTSPVLRI